MRGDILNVLVYFVNEAYFTLAMTMGFYRLFPNDHLYFANQK